MLPLARITNYIRRRFYDSVHFNTGSCVLTTQECNFSTQWRNFLASGQSSSSSSSSRFPPLLCEWHNIYFSLLVLYLFLHCLAFSITLFLLSVLQSPHLPLTTSLHGSGWCLFFSISHGSFQQRGTVCQIQSSWMGRRAPSSAVVMGYDVHSTSPMLSEEARVRLQPCIGIHPPPSLTHSFFEKKQYNGTSMRECQREKNYLR